MSPEEEIRALRLRVAQLEQRLASAQPSPDEQAELLRRIIDAVPHPIYVRGAQGQLLLVNEAYDRLHAQDTGREAKDERQQDLELLASGDMRHLEECQLLSGTGPPAWFHTIRQTFAGPEGQRYLLGIATDVTDLKQARLAAEENARVKQEFLANMSHEIRTPMHGVVGLARLLKKTPVTAEQADYLDLILTNAGNLLVVINDILDFAKMEAGHLELEARPCDVAATVAEVTRSLALAAAAKGLDLRLTLPPAPMPVVSGDAVRLSQVLVNLINNAIKFTTQGSITVAVEVLEPAAEELQLRFSVTDTGIGISPDKIEHVFRSFAQASTNTARLYGGTGLGLAICRRLVELQGGHIAVESVPGRGSCFSFALTYPVTNAPAAPPHEVRPVLPPGLLRGLRVLLVEDNPVNQLLACSLLQEWQAEALVAADGEQALHLAHAASFDVILMDIQMPRLNGLEATAELRRRPGPNQHTPIVALTANALKSDVDTYPHAGFSDWLVKPYHEHNLYQVLARNTGRSQLSVELPNAPVPVVEAPTYGFEGLGRLANDPAFIRKLQQLYVDTVPGQLGQLGEALRHHDWTAAARLVHSLKSTFGNLQIDEALGEIKKIEGQLKKFPDATQLFKLYHSVHHAASQATAVFTAQLQSQNA